MIDKDEQKYWKPVAYPTDNFGLGTLYDGKGPGSLLCATPKCLGLSDNETATLKAANYIEPGRGGSITLDDSQKRTLSINVLATLLSLLNLSGKVDSSKATVVNVEIPAATIRYLMKGTLTSHIQKDSPSAAVTDAFQDRRLRAIVGDIVVDSMTATVKVDDSLSADVKASLDQNVGQTLGKDSSLAVSYSKTGTGTYKLETKKPVIVAVEPAKQPKTGPLQAAETPWPSDVNLMLKN